MRFFEVKFLNVQGISAQKIYNAHTIFPTTKCSGSTA